MAVQATDAAVQPASPSAGPESGAASAAKASASNESCAFSSPGGSGAAAAAFLNSGPSGGASSERKSPGRTEESAKESSGAPVPSPPTLAPSGRPHPKCARDTPWRQVLQELVEDKNSLNSSMLDRCVALASELQHLVQELTEQAETAGLQEAKLSRALCTRLFPRLALSQPQDQSAKIAPTANVSGGKNASFSRLSYGVGDINDDPSRDGQEPIVSTSKFAYVMDHTHRNTATEEPRASALARVEEPRPLAAAPVQECDKRVYTSQRDSMKSEGHQGGLFICKHYAGSPEQIYEMDVKVGEGTFGSVRKALHKQTGQTHVVKSIPKKLIPEDELWAEIDMMKHLDHPHIMRLYYTFEDALHVYIASELCAGGELFDAILGIESTQVLTECSAAKLFKQCLSAVSYLHFHSICHRDLKPENFLLSKKGDLGEVKVKMIDFGTAKRFDLGPMTTKVCTVSYVAPEVLKRNSDPYTEKIDVWSCGVMLYVMLSGTSPFAHDDDKEVLKLVKKGKYKFLPESIWKRISDGAQSLIKRMLCLKVTERCTASEALHDRWFEMQTSEKETALIDEEMLQQMRDFVGHNKLKKVALQVIARSISDDSIDKLREIFLTYDQDESGTLTLSEVDEALKQLDAPESVQLEMHRILCQMDMDGSGDIHWTEFLASTMKAQHYLQEEVCRAAFHMLDTNGDGIISRADLVQLLSAEGDMYKAGLATTISNDSVEEIMSCVDEDGDGTVNFEEFMHMMQDKSITFEAGSMESVQVIRGRKSVVPLPL